MTQFAHTASKYIAFTIFALAYFFSYHLSPWAGFENGPIEMTQNIVLFLGGVQALVFAAKSKMPWRYVWLAIAPIWFVCLGRELSWGAVMFPPLSNSEAGPVYSSRVLPYKFLVAPVIGLLFVFSLGLFVRFKLWATYAFLLQKRQLPVLEICMAIIAFALMTAAESSMGLSLENYIGHEQIFEEAMELSAYVFLLASQQRVRKASQKASI